MDTVGWDIILDVSLLGFDKSDVIQKNQIVLEQGKELPASVNSIFIKKAKAPYRGRIRISLTAKRSAATGRKILDECKIIPVARWYSHIGNIFNGGQKAIRHIPWLGKPLEEVVPDAFQNVKLNYAISVTNEKKLIYRMGLVRTRDSHGLLVFRGEFLLT